MPIPEPFAEPVYVTRPLLPSLSDYTARLEAVWDAKWLTNNGAQHQALERALAEYLRAPNLSLFANGTLALLGACKVLALEGEVITTPFTFPATPHALAWAGLDPVFVDIEPHSMTIDPARIEEAITARTSAIVAVHVYGIPCAVEALAAIAARHRLKLIYDAAHAFGTILDGVPLCGFGDATMLSFHATKLFHTAEGGALIVRDAATKERVDLVKNFGIRSEFDVELEGINAKMSELSAALGLAVLPHLDVERTRRAAIAGIYDAEMADFSGISLPRPPASASHSLQYYVMRVDASRAGSTRDELYDRLKRFNVFARKYFHPLASDYACYRGPKSSAADRLPVARKVASEVLCLPLHGALAPEDARRICAMIGYCLRHSP
jgi:dTDP-4-amino-4,6-dideoxygalactose transaminase